MPVTNEQASNEVQQDDLFLGRKNKSFGAMNTDKIPNRRSYLIAEDEASPLRRSHLVVEPDHNSHNLGRSFAIDGKRSSTRGNTVILSNRNSHSQNPNSTTTSVNQSKRRSVLPSNHTDLQFQPLNKKSSISSKRSVDTQIFKNRPSVIGGLL